MIHSSMSVDDLIAGLGLVLVGLGVGVIYWPAALILVGLLLTGVAVLRVR